MPYRRQLYALARPPTVRFLIELTSILVVCAVIFVLSPYFFITKIDASPHDVTPQLRRSKAPQWISRQGSKEECSFLNGSEAAVFFHAWPQNAWRHVMDDVVATLQSSHLAACGVPSFVGFPTGEEWPYEGVDPLLRRMELPLASKGREHNEPVTLAGLAAWCSEAPKNRIAIYIHDKGVRKPMNDVVHYLREWDWRKLHEYFLIERPQGCFRALTSDTADTCGVNLRIEPANHYSGNFWAARCDYIVRLPLPLEWVWDKNSFFSPEFWIGQLAEGKGRAVRLFNCFSSNVNHYTTEFSRALYVGESCDVNVPMIM